MAYQENLEAMARLKEVALPLQEKDLDIFAVNFSGEVPILGSSKNRGSRLFLETHIPQDQHEFSCANLREAAALFFAKHWEDALNGGDHPMLRGIMECSRVALLRKSHMKRMIEEVWENRADITFDTHTGTELHVVVTAALVGLGNGTFRIAEKIEGTWVTNQWLKQACLLSFRLRANGFINGCTYAWDKVPLKGSNWSAEQWEESGIRLVPSAIVRESVFIAPKGVVLMAHSFVNMGAYVDEGTMVDTGARVGSCAQVGKRVHIGAGSGIGGVFEPLQANPTIIEDDVFIGAMCEVAEGVVVGEGAVLAMGTLITASTKIVDRKTGTIVTGNVPPYSVVVPGSLPDPNGGPSVSCAVIIKTVDGQTRSKVGINDLLRD